MRFLLTILSKLKKKITPSLIRNYKRKKRDEKIKKNFQGYPIKYSKKSMMKTGGGTLTNKKGNTHRVMVQEIQKLSRNILMLSLILSKNPKLKTGLDLGCGDLVWSSLL